MRLVITLLIAFCLVLPALAGEDEPSSSSAPKPPKKLAAHGYLDFWIGTYEVFDRSGTLLGTSTITSEENGFVLTERWKNVKGETGRSYSHVDPATGTWRQTWIDARGHVGTFVGSGNHRDMRFEGTLVSSTGTRVLERRRLRPLSGIGALQKEIEQSMDDGATWRQTFLGVYRPPRK